MLIVINKKLISELFLTISLKRIPEIIRFIQYQIINEIISKLVRSKFSEISFG